MAFEDLLEKCGLQLESELSDSGRSFLSKQIRTKIVATHVAVRSGLEGGAHFRRKRLNVVEPPPDMSLRDLSTGDFGELSRECSLPPDDSHRPLNRFAMIRHAAEFDKLTCLVQQANLSGGDRQNSHPYCRSMEKQDWESLSGRLAWAMKQRDWNDRELAKQVNSRQGTAVSWQTVQGVRSGTTAMTTYVAHFAQALECDAIWLATGDGEPYVKGLAAGAAGELTGAAMAFAKRWQALSPPLRAKMADVLVAYESLAESETPTPEPSKQRRRPARAE